MPETGPRKQFKQAVLALECRWICDEHNDWNGRVLFSPKPGLCPRCGRVLRVQYRDPVDIWTTGVYRAWI